MFTALFAKSHVNATLKAAGYGGLPWCGSVSNSQHDGLAWFGNVGGSNLMTLVGRLLDKQTSATIARLVKKGLYIQIGKIDEMNEAWSMIVRAAFVDATSSLSSSEAAVINAVTAEIKEDIFTMSLQLVRDCQNILRSAFVGEKVTGRFDVGDGLTVEIAEVSPLQPFNPYTMHDHDEADKALVAKNFASGVMRVFDLRAQVKFGNRVLATRTINNVSEHVSSPGILNGYWGYAFALTDGILDESVRREYITTQSQCAL